ncbi:MAG: hypothetical protein AB1505_32310, partial [Candidatus Latescibacterota bacterium]
MHDGIPFVWPATMRLAVGRDRSLWIAYDGSYQRPIVHWTTDERLECWVEGEEAIPGGPLDIEVGMAGRTWVVSMAAVAAYDGMEWRVSPLPYGQLCLAVAPSGEPWVTGDAGTRRYDGGRWQLADGRAGQAIGTDRQGGGVWVVGAYTASVFHISRDARVE